MPATLIREFAARDADRLAAALAGMRDLPEQLTERRKQMFGDAAEARRLPELHAGRDDYRRLYDHYVGAAEHYAGVAEAAGDPSAADFARVADEVRAQRDDLFGRWQTLDDLYRVVIDLFTPSPERSAYLAAKYPPPASFWDETDDPFSD